MVRNGEVTKKSILRAVPQRMMQFFDRNFDWIVWVFITLLILLVFVLF